VGQAKYIIKKINPNNNMHVHMHAHARARAHTHTHRFCYILGYVPAKKKG